MNEAPPSRRWFQFSLRTMLLLSALIAVSAFAFKEHWERRRLDAANAALEAKLAYARDKAAADRRHYNEQINLVGKQLQGMMRNAVPSPPPFVPRDLFSVPDKAEPSENPATH